MEDFARLSSQERAEAFSEAAARKGVAASIIEKDYWVCWTLKRLFSLENDVAGMIFKGGTSLSKAFGLIERFSEDIDVTLDRRDFGFVDKRDPANAKSANVRKLLLSELQKTSEAHVCGELLKRIRHEMEKHLESEVWSLDVDNRDAQTLNFTYPPSLTAGDYASFGYISPIVRIEFGARADHWPATLSEVTPYAAEIFPDLFREPSCIINTLRAERTFWEKATILHMEYHRPEAKAFRDRLSRHYYDLALLARNSVRETALQKIDLLAVVATHKSIFFRSGWARYDEAKPGSLRLTPHPRLEAALKTDYAKMESMIFGDAPDFETILADLADLETDINS